MGRFFVDVELANDADLARASAGDITPDQVRRVRIKGAVDTGAARLVIPDSVAKQLGVTEIAKAKVRYADGRVDERSVVSRVHFSYGGRESIFNAVVEPGMDQVLIGAIVLEDLDFLVDCFSQKLVPRDPKQIVSEV